MPKFFRIQTDRNYMVSFSHSTTYLSKVSFHKKGGVQGYHLVQSFAKGEGKPTWRTVIRMDIRDAIGVSFSWSQFVKEMEKRGYTWKLNRKYGTVGSSDRWFLR